MIHSCKKDSKSETSEVSENKKDPAIAPKTDTVPKATANKYAGPCPYECDDPRCANYSEPCEGGSEEPNPQISITPVQSSNVQNEMTTSFQSLQVNFTQLSSELGLSYTLNATNIDFQNLSNTYVTNDDGVGQAIGAPFKNNSSSTSTNYAFILTVDADSVYRPFIVKTTFNQSIKYYDLSEGHILTVNNYNNINTLSFQNSLGNYLNTSRTAYRAMNCGQDVMNCIIDAYSNHGWTSVWLGITSAFLWQTGVGVAGACAIKNCAPKKSMIW